jgi:DNA-directed RNA polymerase specialized sigma24 family protein
MLYEEEQVKSVISRYLQGIFALVLYLTAGEQDVAYEVCAESFAQAIRTAPPLEQEENFLTRLTGIAVAKSRNVKTIPDFEGFDLLEVSETDKAPLRIVLSSLLKLDFDSKAAILLRSQLCFSYKDIASIMRTSESNARHMTTQAKILLRQKIEEMISYAERDKNQL